MLEEISKLYGTTAGERGNRGGLYYWCGVDHGVCGSGGLIFHFKNTI
jgi:hypothetical protein